MNNSRARLLRGGMKELEPGEAGWNEWALPKGLDQRVAQLTRIQEDLNWGSGSRIIRSEISTGCFDPLSHEYKSGFLSSIPAQLSKSSNLQIAIPMIEKSPIQLAEQP
ncbi:hypothetical protein Tco_0393203 [Tanacetum coccineum]